MDAWTTQDSNSLQRQFSNARSEMVPINESSITTAVISTKPADDQYPVSIDILLLVLCVVGMFANGVAMLALIFFKQASITLN